MKLVLRKSVVLFTLLGCAFLGNKVSAQKLAFKTNALTWATLSPNLGFEVVLNAHLSLDCHATYRPFNFQDKPFRVLVLQPELRYWPGRPSSRHFFGVTAFYLDNNIEWKNTRYKGDGVAGGISYGYSWVLSNHWNIEASIGAGMLYTRQFKSKSDEEQPRSINYHKWLPVPMKCAVSFVYLLK
ncbi:MAG: DUF3575 domain-containing protein [Bacteroidales bacterium]